MPLVDYKAKYLDLKTKYQETVDLAWRLGFEQGARQAQLDQASQQQAQADQMAMAAMDNLNQANRARKPLQMKKPQPASATIRKP